MTGWKCTAPVFVSTRSLLLTSWRRACKSTKKSWHGGAAFAAYIMCNVGGDEVAHNFYEREARLDPRDSIRPFLNPFSQAFDANPMLSPDFKIFDSLDGFRFPFYFLRILLELSYTFASKKNEDAPFSAVYETILSSQVRWVSYGLYRCKATGWQLDNLRNETRLNVPWLDARTRECIVCRNCMYHQEITLV